MVKVVTVIMAELVAVIVVGIVVIVVEIYTFS